MTNTTGAKRPNSSPWSEVDESALDPKDPASAPSARSARVSHVVSELFLEKYPMYGQDPAYRQAIKDYMLDLTHKMSKLINEVGELHFENLPDTEEPAIRLTDADDVILRSLAVFFTVMCVSREAPLTEHYHRLTKIYLDDAFELLKILNEMESTIASQDAPEAQLLNALPVGERRAIILSIVGERVLTITPKEVEEMLGKIASCSN